MADLREYRRIILNLYWNSGDQRTITAAAGFARLLGLDLLGIYVEDEAVHGLAGLPFAREIKLPTHEWGSIHAERIAAEFRHAAMSAERMLARTAAALGVSSSFEVMRGDPSASVTTQSRAGDIVVFAEPRMAGERMTRSFARSWQAAAASAASVLLMPSRLARQRGAVAAVFAGHDDASVITAARIALAADEDLLLLVPGRGRKLREDAIAAARASGMAESRIHTRWLPALSAEGILHALADCPERLVVLDREVLAADADAAIFAVAAQCCVPILIVDGGGTALEAQPARNSRGP
jgi:hypothetical protein